MNRQKWDAALQKARRLLLGMQITDGWIFKIIVYVLLISMGFIFILPIIKMLSSSFKELSDILDPTVGYIPSHLYLDNYRQAMQVMDAGYSLPQALMLALVPAALQTAAAAVVGYGLARFEFPGKKLYFALMVGTFIIPSQITAIPRYLMLKDMGVFSIFLPALFGQGLKSTIFILIFYQFFRMIPKSLEEAAQLDGAGMLKIFIKIAIPMAIPSIIVSFIFSMVWYWNETYMTKLFLQDQFTTMQIELQSFSKSYEAMFSAGSGGQTSNVLNEGVIMAGTILTILPMLIIYFILQRWFVEGIDRSGITGE